MKIAIDAMGGDHAPKEIVLGALKAIDTYPDVEITLVGDENKINQYLKDRQSNFHYSYRRGYYRNR